VICVASDSDAPVHLLVKRRPRHDWCQSQQDGGIDEVRDKADMEGECVTDQTLHMIGNAHLDPVWLWQWQEGLQEVKATFRAVLDLMAEADDFLFTCSSAALYAWVEHNDPAMFNEIRRRVAEGRWEIVGGWWIQPDCNIPGGESYVRQGLYGQRYFKEKFGVTATVGYNVDSFGHHGMLPQILRKSGLDAYVFMRPHTHELHVPARLFWWESDDGSRVLAFRLPYSYNTGGADLAQHVRACMEESPASGDDLMCFYGVGNHGGGPTRANLESIRTLARDPAYPVLAFSTPSRFFAQARDGLSPIPVVHDELQHHASGCYAAHSGIKRWNRHAEHALLSAEKLSTLAARLVGHPYPDDLARGWKGVLFNQFHDILAGTSIAPAYDDAHDLYGEALSIAARALNSAVQSMSWRIAIPPGAGDLPIVVFNPHAWENVSPIEVEIGRLVDGSRLIDDEGRTLDMQVIHSLATVSGGRNRVLFLAELPSFGYRTYRIVAPAQSSAVALSSIRDAADTPPTPATSAPWIGIGDAAPTIDRQPDAGVADSLVLPSRPEDDASDDAYLLENAHLRVRIDPRSGCIASFYDKRERFEIFRGDGGRGIVIQDHSDTWSHGVTRFDDAIGVFAVRKVARIERGPVRSSIRVESVYGQSRLRQDILLYRDLDRVEVRVTVDWREQFKALKVRFPLNLSGALRATYEIPYGHIDRPTDGEEEPGQRWIDLSGTGHGIEGLYGLGILNDGKYSFDVSDRDLHLTVLRSPIYAHHVPYVPRPAADGSYDDYHFIDQGVQSFIYVLAPHRGGWEDAGIVRRAEELNARPIAYIETFHAGPLPPHGSYLDVDRDNVSVSVVKKAEDNDDVIVRCVEMAGRAVRATVRLTAWGRTIEAAFAPCEIKTFRLPSDPALPVRDVDLIEWDADTEEPSDDGH